MSLKAILQNAAVSALNALGDATETVEYYRVQIGGYNIATDQNTQTTTRFTFKAAVYKTKEENQDWKKTTLYETKVLIAGKDFETAGFEPDEQDYMVIDGVRHEFKINRPSPAKAVYVFTVRAV